MARTPKWQFYVHRDFNIFVQWIQTVVTQQNVQRRVFGFSVPLNNYLILAGDEFADARDTNTYGLFLRKKLRSHSNFFTTFAQREQKLVRDAQALQKHLQKNTTRYTSFSYKQLHSELEKFLSIYIPIFGTAFVRPDDFLEHRVRLLLGTSADRLFPILATYPHKKATKLSYLQEPIDLLKIATALKKARAQVDRLPKPFRVKLEQHLHEYAWLKNPNLTELVFVKRTELLERLRFLLQNEPAKQLREIQHARKKQAQRFQALTKKEHFSKETQRAIQDLQTFIFLRTYTTEAADRLFYIARTTLFAEIAKRMKLLSAFVCTCTGDEILRFLQTGNNIPSRTELRGRTKNFAVVWKQGRGKLFFGNEARKLLRKYAQLRSATEKHSTELKGQTAFSGKIQGKVRVLKHWKEAGKLKKGDILVVSMTTPEYIQAMEKASAFITDEGGITCHAAIIAREMQKPCVIGTRNATKVLKTGDRVEVDATKGMVTIINQ